MRSTLTYAAFLAVFFSLGHAQAACGGGGFKPSKSSKPATEAQSNPTIYVLQTESRTYTSSLDTSHFDSVSSRLELTRDQWKEISKARSAINEQSEKLVKAQVKAQRKLNHCQGNCAKEERELARSSEALKNYNAKDEFEARLRGILPPGQAETYFHG